MVLLYLTFLGVLLSKTYLFDLYIYLYMYIFFFQTSQKMAGTVNWGTATVIGVFAGMFYGGSKEAAASVVSTPFPL